LDLQTNSAGKQEVLVSGSQGKPLIARTWFGRTRKEHADDYLRYNYENGVLEVEKKPGCLAMQQFRRIRGDIAEFTTVVWVIGVGLALYWTRISPLSFGATVPVFILTFVLYLLTRFTADRVTGRHTVSESDRGAG
jgi:hypothetical protein